MVTIAPAIFVPTDRDFTKTPPPLSDDPADRLDASIKELDWHAVHVENNMMLMFQREAERIRRVAEQDPTPSGSNQRPVKEPALRTGNELLLEERIIEEDSEAVIRILKDAKYRESEDSREGPHPRFPPRPRRPHDPEYADLATLRQEKMFMVPVDGRQTPREEALTYVLNLVKWGWDDQLEGHRAVVQKEKDDRRAKLHFQVGENALPNALSGSVTHTQLSSAARVPKRMRNESFGGDRMDIDGK